MKQVFFFFFLILISTAVFSQNPITPAGVYFADPSAHVWDGKLYLYGSLDKSCDYYCSRDHHVLSTTDMKNWKVHENVFSSAGKNDEVPYNDDLLFAPDCAMARDSFYLYYCQPNPESAEGVAVSTSPTGPFVNGQPLNVGEYNEIDPSLFIDDDGEAYYMWGQFNLKMARMKPNMREIDTSTIQTNILTEEEHHFHEGAYMAKRNGIYYLVYADLSRADMPTCIGYATSKSPFGPYTYGGVIVDNDHCNPGNWNNHGSIAEFNGQWYVFYHRSTHGCNKMRKACVEPITFNPDGSIPEVEMTSQGAGGPLEATSDIEAEWACLLQGGLRIEAFAEHQESLTHIRNGDKAVFKYIDFNDNPNSISFRISPGKDGGTIIVSSDKPWHKQLAQIHIEGGSEEKKWKTVTKEIKDISGVHAIWLQFYANGDDLFSIDRLKFNQ
jgi:beta-xylosidase